MPSGTAPLCQFSGAVFRLFVVPLSLAFTVFVCLRFFSWYLLNLNLFLQNKIKKVKIVEIKLLYEPKMGERGTLNMTIHRSTNTS